MGLDGKLPMGEENSHSALSPTIHDTFPFVELLFLRSTGMDVEDPPMSAFLGSTNMDVEDHLPHGAISPLMIENPPMLTTMSQRHSFRVS